MGHEFGGSITPGAQSLYTEEPPALPIAWLLPEARAGSRRLESSEGTTSSCAQGRGAAGSTGYVAELFSAELFLLHFSGSTSGIFACVACLRFPGPGPVVGELCVARLLLEACWGLSTICLCKESLLVPSLFSSRSGRWGRTQAGPEQRLPRRPGSAFLVRSFPSSLGWNCFLFLLRYDWHIALHWLKVCTMMLSICIYCEMITTVHSVLSSPHTVTVCFLVRTFNIS